MQVTANGIDFVCQIDGPEGAPWLTFSNSLNTNVSLWDEQVALLSDRYRILRYNTRGHDGTGAPPGPWDLEDLASDIVALWDELHIATSHFVGLSIGGMTGQALALGWPERINAFVLADTRADFTGEFAATVPGMIESVARDGLDSLVEVMPLRWFTDNVRAAQPDLVERARRLIASNTADGYIACAGAMTRLNYIERLHEINLHTLLICGAQDLGTPPAGMREMAARIPNATYVEIDPAGHLSNIENPAAFNAALFPFLDSFDRATT
ncbi:MAG: alpha/beta fold hydrolase [Alphaproteobacteria bacterium]|nr:alpha/beta fold hydrolase [Alphaproteobacteria bacterium]